MPFIAPLAPPCCCIGICCIGAPPCCCIGTCCTGAPPCCCIGTCCTGAPPGCGGTCCPGAPPCCIVGTPPCCTGALPCCAAAPAAKPSARVAASATLETTGRVLRNLFIVTAPYKLLRYTTGANRMPV
ncbi:hypothetical protein EYW47_08180 [Paraburkholderia silviterrae]|uniref:Uncharacterized protein n=1 Tax=Paraburkholderia silviterrae TaxID=2528715 RepID=A0A4R5MC73_9BURK|nr:hypothetical protein EYW47_08180 [Paraburkholderia silviterrae]